MRFRSLALAAMLLPIAALPLSAQEGLTSVLSPYSVSDTIDKLETVLEAKGMKVFSRIDHAAGAAGADLELRPTIVLLFGNPKVGTPLMQCSQSIAIDLPQKMLAWQDEAGDIHLGWNDPLYLKGRHDTAGCDEVFTKVSGALANFAKAATAE